MVPMTHNEALLRLKLAHRNHCSNFDASGTHCVLVLPRLRQGRTHGRPSATRQSDNMRGNVCLFVNCYVVPSLSRSLGKQSLALGPSQRERSTSVTRLTKQLGPRRRLLRLTRRQWTELWKRCVSPPPRCSLCCNPKVVGPWREGGRDTLSPCVFGLDWHRLVQPYVSQQARWWLLALCCRCCLSHGADGLRG